MGNALESHPAPIIWENIKSPVIWENIKDKLFKNLREMLVDDNGCDKLMQSFTTIPKLKRRRIYYLLILTTGINYLFNAFLYSDRDILLIHIINIHLIY